jgi:hypothetical protein
MSLLTLGNTKLGPGLIWSFSLPAIDTCPGKSELCGGEHGACYATKGRYLTPSVRDAYARNWEIAER